MALQSFNANFNLNDIELIFDQPTALTNADLARFVLLSMGTSAARPRVIIAGSTIISGTSPTTNYTVRLSSAVVNVIKTQFTGWIDSDSTFISQVFVEPYTVLPVTTYTPDTSRVSVVTAEYNRITGVLALDISKPTITCSLDQLVLTGAGGVNTVTLTGATLAINPARVYVQLTPEQIQATQALIDETTSGPIQLSVTANAGALVDWVGNSSLAQTVAATVVSPVYQLAQTLELTETGIRVDDNNGLGTNSNDNIVSVEDLGYLSYIPIAYTGTTGPVPTGVNNRVPLATVQSVTLAFSGTNLYTSFDGGITWTNPITTLPNLNWTDVIVSESARRVVAFSEDSTATAIITVIDSTVSYTAGGALPATGFRAGALGIGGMVVVANNTIATSPDGTNWTSATVTGNWLGVAYGAGRFVIVGGSNNTATSPDGGTWTINTVNPGTTVNWTYIAYGETVGFVMADSNSAVAVSVNGINWTTSTTGSLPVINSVRSYKYGAGVYLSVTQSQSGSEYITYLSGDGLNWTQSAVSVPTAFRALTYSSQFNRFIYVNDVSGSDSVWGIGAAPGAQNQTRVEGALRVTGVSILGDANNISITGGTAGQYLQAMGNGALTWSTIAAGDPTRIINGNTSVEIPAANGNIQFYTANASNIKTSIANISSNGITVNGNLTTTGTGVSTITSGSDINLVTGGSGTGAVNVTGNLNVSRVANLGPVANVRIANGSNGQYLRTDGLGNLSWASVGSGNSISNGNTDVSIGTADGNITGNISNFQALAIERSTGPSAGGRVAVGSGAGATNQGGQAVAIGSGAGLTNQGSFSVAIGACTALTTQSANSVAVGAWAGGTTQGTEAVAVGRGAGNGVQGAGAIAIGFNAGNSNQGNYSIAVGWSAGFANTTANSIYIGSDAGRDGGGFANVIVLNSTGAAFNPTVGNATFISSLRANVSTGNAVYYNNATGELSYAPAASGNSIRNGNSDVSIGTANGNITGNVVDAIVLNLTANSVAVGANSGVAQGSQAVAIGMSAGSNSQGASAVAIGANAAAASQSSVAIAIGANAASNAQGNYSIAVGFNAGSNTQGANSVAIARQAGQTSQGDNSVAIGLSAGSNTQGDYAVAIGQFAAQEMQSEAAVAIGTLAGTLNQGDNAIAIGASAGYSNQAANTVAIGISAGSTNTTANSIYIGAYAGNDAGNYANVIVLNSRGTALDPAQANSTYISSVRKESNALAISNVANVGIVTWDSTTSELRQGSPIFTYAQENITIVASAPSATTNFDILSNSIAFYTSNATTDVTLNFRGNSTTTASSLLAVGQSITCTFIMTVGTTQYTVSAVQIDGTSVTPKYVSNISPVAESNVRNSLTYTIIKTSAAPAYVVLGAQTLYGY